MRGAWLPEGERDAGRKQQSCNFQRKRNCVWPASLDTPAEPGREELGGPQMCQRSRQGQGGKGNREGRDRTRDFPAPWVCSALRCLPHRAVSLLPAPLSPSSLALQAKESIEQLVYLCQTDKEPVREAAKQSLMLCGECPAAPACSFPTHSIPSGISWGQQCPRVPGWSLPTPRALAHHAPSSARQEQAGSGQRGPGVLWPQSAKPGCYLLFARWH